MYLGKMSDKLEDINIQKGMTGKSGEYHGG